ncbi:hypothetical protein E2C01_080466 [Portunus trituberculatus]|uniref:Uncharacterized protein n=1 Tax=Portunus trituberculatus TaxID=210409 RepID=A0A5B7IPB6_PORTR|nr:hypothetical protein [Portunus trituberculatus]
MCEEDYKQILDNKIIKRPINHHALAPVECNAQILEALKNANYHNNLGRRFIIKSEINPRYNHLCSEKVSMKRFLFGDDVSQSAKTIEDSAKLKNKFS